MATPTLLEPRRCGAWTVPVPVKWDVVVAYGSSEGGEPTLGDPARSKAGEADHYQDGLGAEGA